MKKVLFISMLLSMAAMTAIAVPAKRGLWKTITLANGQTVKATLVGDEFGHFWKAEDGKIYTKSGNFFKQADSEKVINRAKAMRRQENAKRTKKFLELNVGSYFGKKKGVIILVNFKDIAFQANHTNELYQKIANEPGYSEGKFKGSISDYFKAQSGNQFELDFDVVGPVTVSKNAKYYGENDDNDNDMHPGEMICEAVELAKNMVSDWHQYDWDNDGKVDQVYIIYAGKGAADSDDENTIWPHAYDLYSSNYYGDGTGPVTVAEGLQVNTYACGCEVDGDNMIEGIGTICHEFSHCLGYPDFYDIDYSGGQGMGSWDLMDSGNYNGGGYQPAGYTSYERWLAGWLTPIELDSVDVNVTNMKSLQNGGESYVIYNKGNKNEFLMLENRQRDNWDASLPDAGLLIVHCDYDKKAWDENGPNDDPDHQRMVVVPADGRYQYGKYMGQTYATEEGDVFPQEDVDAFNKNFKAYDMISKKAAKFFTKNTNGTFWIDSSVEGITQNEDGSISFNYVANYAGSNQGGNDGEALFYESFDQCNGTGGNDGKWSGSIASADFMPDYDDWTINTNSGKAYAGYKCARIGASRAKGDATTPEFNLNGEAKLTFRAGAWKADNEGTVLTISATGAQLSENTVTMETGAFNDYELTLTGEGPVTLTFKSLSGTKSRFFLDEVLVMPVTTAINTVNATRATGRIYTLDGRFVGTDKGALKHGIYVIDGKKIIK